MNKLNGNLRIRIEQDKIQAFKNRCKSIGVKYTVVIRNLLQVCYERSTDEDLKNLGEE